MTKNILKSSFHEIKNSKFVRSMFIRILLIFLIVIIGVIAIVFFSFTSVINKSLVSERQKQLEVIEDTISKRMDEISSIAYNIGADKTFYLEAVKDDKYNGYEMSSTLSRYLVGNDFIEHLAYYRLSEPDTIYTSSGELNFSDFWSTYMGISDEEKDEIISGIQKSTSPEVRYLSFGDDNSSFFTYLCPLPEFSKNPKAFVLMMIPLTEIKPILETQLVNCYGEVALFDASGNQIYMYSNMDEDIPVNLTDEKDESYISYNGSKYIMQKKASVTNSWTYVSVIRMNDIISEVATKQIIFIVLLLIIMIIAIFVMLMSIISQYKPINSLAMTFTENKGKTGSGRSTVIDEESLLADNFAILKGDSEQKQKFEAAYYAAEEANKAKSAFLSNMSHDIRTPMNAIVGMTEIAIKYLDDPKYVRECLQKVQVASQYLLDIINNILDMSRIESGKFTLTEDVIEFPKFIYGIITILNQSLSVKSQKFIVDVGEIRNENVIGDNVRLTQVFINILSNSVKFTPNEGTISLSMIQKDSIEEGFADYEFVFADNGIGMSSEFTTQVFETFTRDKNAGIARIEGTGLGMAIAKSFVELMGGTIRCKSELNKGTTFTVTMHMKIADIGEEFGHDKYKDMSVLITGPDELTCINQSSRFTSIGVKTDYALNIDDASEMIWESVSRNHAYNFVIINQTDDDKSGIKTIAMLPDVSDVSDMTYVLAARDILSVEQSSAYNAGIMVFVQTPLFRSTVMGILDRTTENSDATENNSIINLKEKRVLLVEDNEINMQIAHALIDETNAEVYEAVNGREAVEAFRNHEPGYFDVIMMDVQMPVMNGYEATMAIRSIQREDAAVIPIYAMTANTFDEDVRQVREAGMNGHLGKPYVAKDLYLILEQACTE